MADRSMTPPPQGDQDKSGGLLATTILVTVISVMLMIFRLLTRIFIVKRVGWDDWTILFAVLGHPIGMALVVVQINYGLGRPVYYLTDHQYQEFMKYAYGEWLQTFATLMFTKVSICLFLLRITVTKKFNRALQGAIVILVVSNVILSLLWILQCRPHLDRAWNTKMPGKCFSKGQLERIIIAQAIISFISDFFLSIFPILILRKVQISLRSKVGLCLLMGLGVVTGSLGIARTVLNWQNVTSDPTWVSIPNWYIRTWEVLFGVVAASAPALRPGYKWLVDKIQTRFATMHWQSFTSYYNHSSKRNASGGFNPQPEDVHWTPPKPSAFSSSEKSSSSSPSIPSFKKQHSTSSDSETGVVIGELAATPIRGSLASKYLSKKHKRKTTQSTQSPPPPTPPPKETKYQHDENEKEMQDQPRYPRDDRGFERREDVALRIPGDMSANRPGRMKRLDSEAKVGGGYGDEEVDYRL